MAAVFDLIIFLFFLPVFFSSCVVFFPFLSAFRFIALLKIMATSFPTYTWDEIKKHVTEEDCWVVLNDNVLNVTAFLNEHPGGLDPIKDMAGEDITSSFESIGHSSTAVVRSKQMIVGRLDPACKKKIPVSNAPAPKWSESNLDDLKNYKGATTIIPLPVIGLGAFALLAVLYVLCGFL